MNGLSRFAAGLALAASVLLSGGVAQAQAQGQSVGVQPATAEPGDTVTVTGKGLGANREVEVRLVGMGVDADFGELKTDGDGAFTTQVRLPESLAAGAYRIRAVGAKTAETDLSVAASGAANPAMAAPAAVPARERSVPETVGLVALFGAIAVLGLFFAHTAREGAGGQTAG